MFSKLKMEDVIPVANSQPSYYRRELVEMIEFVIVECVRMYKRVYLWMLCGRARANMFVEFMFVMCNNTLIGQQKPHSRHMW
jgi:hypothetical protein